MPHKVFKGSLIGLKISYDGISNVEINNDGISYAEISYDKISYAENISCKALSSNI